MDFKFSRFGFRRKNPSSSSSNNTTPTTSAAPQIPPIPNQSTQTLIAPPSNGATSPGSAPSHTSSSSTSLPMNPNPNPNALGRPPSYSYNRSASPMPPQQMPHHPPPLNTNVQYTQPAMQHMGAPPGYGLQQPVAQPVPPMPYVRNPAVEVEGSGRSKAQLIVGIDFGTTFSGVAFAFATNNEAREDIITEWPGAGTHTKQKVVHVPRNNKSAYTRTDVDVSDIDSNSTILRSIPKSGRMGSGYRRRSRSNWLSEAGGTKSRMV